MKVYIDKMVYQVLDEFYDVSMKKHIALDYFVLSRCSA